MITGARSAPLRSLMLILVGEDIILPRVQILIYSGDSFIEYREANSLPYKLVITFDKFKIIRILI